MPIALAHWLLRRAIYFAVGRIAAPVIEPFKKDLHRMVLGLVLVFAGGTAAIVCGLVLTPIMAAPGIAVWIAGLFVCLAALVSTFRHARSTYHQSVELGGRTYRQSVALGRRTWPHLRALGLRRRRQ